jgi:hypothetical protein
VILYSLAHSSFLINCRAASRQRHSKRATRHTQATNKPAPTATSTAHDSLEKDLAEHGRRDDGALHARTQTASERAAARAAAAQRARGHATVIAATNEKKGTVTDDRHHAVPGGRAVRGGRHIEQRQVYIVGDATPPADAPAHRLRRGEAATTPTCK